MPRIIYILASVFLLVVLLSGLSYLTFRDNIDRFRHNPRIPFQASEKPPAPDYANPESWLRWPMESGPMHAADDNKLPSTPSTGEADIFYVHATTYTERERWNAPLRSAPSDIVLETITLPNEAGPFARLGSLYAPRYRQATLFAQFTHKYDGRAAFELAYNDVRRAFEHYLAQADDERPLFLVGYGQGGLHIQGLLDDYLEPGTRTYDRLIAAYVIDHPTVDHSDLNSESSTPIMVPPCYRSGETGCVFAYVSVVRTHARAIKHARRRTLMMYAGIATSISKDPKLCINPLSRIYKGAYMGPEAHRGAASATGLRFTDRPPFCDRSCGCRMQRRHPAC